MYCQHCGAAAPTQARFCASCGSAVAIAAVPQISNRVAQHVRLLAILWIARAGLKLMAGMGIIFLGRVFLPIIFGAVDDRLPFFVPGLVAASGWLILLLALPSLAVGLGLFSHESWARPLAIVMGFLSLLSPILGTALGIYTLWVLLPARADAEYRSLAKAA